MQITAIVTPTPMPAEAPGLRRFTWPVIAGVIVFDAGGVDVRIEVEDAAVALALGLGILVLASSGSVILK